MQPAIDIQARFRLAIDADCVESKALDFVALIIGDRCYP
jgi:hypothetical protein